MCNLFAGDSFLDDERPVVGWGALVDGLLVRKEEPALAGEGLEVTSAKERSGDIEARVEVMGVDTFMTGPETGTGFSKAQCSNGPEVGVGVNAATRGATEMVGDAASPEGPTLLHVWGSESLMSSFSFLSFPRA